MKVYLMRHGIAADAGIGIATDAERPLTDEGRQKTVKIARGLRALGLSAPRVLASPLLRAVQTAEIVAKVLAKKEDVEIVEALAPGGNLPDLIRALRGSRDVLAVGHMPDLSYAAGGLLTGEARGVFDFRKGGVACFAFEGPVRPGRGVLEWLLTPRMLRTIGGD